MNNEEFLNKLADELTFKPDVGKMQETKELIISRNSYKKSSIFSFLLKRYFKFAFVFLLIVLTAGSGIGFYYLNYRNSSEVQTGNKPEDLKPTNSEVLANLPKGISSEINLNNNSKVRVPENWVATVQENGVNTFRARFDSTSSKDSLKDYFELTTGNDININKYALIDETSEINVNGYKVVVTKGKEDYRSSDRQFISARLLTDKNFDLTLWNPNEESLSEFYKTLEGITYSYTAKSPEIMAKNRFDGFEIRDIKVNQEFKVYTITKNDPKFALSHAYGHAHIYKFDAFKGQKISFALQSIRDEVHVRGELLDNNFSFINRSNSDFRAPYTGEYYYAVVIDPTYTGIDQGEYSFRLIDRISDTVTFTLKFGDGSEVVCAEIDQCLVVRPDFDLYINIPYPFNLEKDTIIYDFDPGYFGSEVYKNVRTKIEAFAGDKTKKNVDIKLSVTENPNILKVESVKDIFPVNNLITIGGLSVLQEWSPGQMGFGFTPFNFIVKTGEVGSSNKIKDIIVKERNIKIYRNEKYRFEINYYDNYEVRSVSSTGGELEIIELINKDKDYNLRLKVTSDPKCLENNNRRGEWVANPDNQYSIISYTYRGVRTNARYELVLRPVVDFAKYLQDYTTCNYFWQTDNVQSPTGKLTFIAESFGDGWTSALDDKDHIYTVESLRTKY